MPLTTRMRPEFAAAINEIADGLSNAQVARRAGCSAEYVRKMRQDGLVPGKIIIQNIAEGFKDKGDYLHRLMVAAGYEQSKDSVLAIEYALRQTTDLSEEGKRQVLDFARKVKEEHAEYGGGPGEGEK